MSGPVGARETCCASFVDHSARAGQSALSSHCWPQRYLVAWSVLFAAKPHGCSRHTISPKLGLFCATLIPTSSSIPEACAMVKTCDPARFMLLSTLCISGVYIGAVVLGHLGSLVNHTAISHIYAHTHSSWTSVG